MRTHLLCLALLTPLAPAQDAASVPIRVMTFNVRYGTASDGENHWCRRRELVADAIRRNRPQVLGVQEALAFQVQFLEERFPHYHRLGVGRDADGGGELSALFVDVERFAVTDSGTRWLSATPDVAGSKGWDAALPRICTWAELRDRRSGHRIRVWNTHFDHRGRTARLESGRAIAGWIAASDLPDIVMGDLNSSEDSDALDALRAGGLRDSFRVAEPGATRAGTFGGFRGIDTGAKIDYVLVDDRFDIGAAVIDRTRYSGRDPSDHYPVTADLTIRGSGSTR